MRPRKVKPYYDQHGVTVYHGDVLACLAALPEESVHCVATSPPYWGLRDYGCEGQLGLEATPEEYVARMVEVFRAVRRVLRSDGTLWLNMGDCYASSGAGGPAQSDLTTMTGGRKDYDLPPRQLAGLKPKDLVGQPWRLAFALQADGWWLRSEIIWAKPNPMPESVKDRPTKAHETVFLLTKSARYSYDADAVREAHKTPPHAPGNRSMRRIGDRAATDPANDPDRTWGNPAGRNLRDVWTIATEPFPAAHFATFPRALVRPCVRAGCPEGGVVLDPFAGSLTTLAVAREEGCRAIGIELNRDYIDIGIKHRLAARDGRGRGGTASVPAPTARRERERGRK